MSLVCDTGVVVAAARSDDPDHAACRRLLVESTERRVLPAPTLVEIEYLLRGTRAWDGLVGDVLTGGLDVVDLTLDDYTRVRDVMTTYADLSIGFVDAGVLAIVERLDEPKLATLDHRHFSVVRPRHVDALELLP